MKPKALNPPERIWLVVGDIEETCEFHDCDEVTWCSAQQYDADVEYRLVKRRRKHRAPTETGGLP